MVVGGANEALRADILERQAGHDLVDRRIEAFLGSGRLVDKGDMRRRRYSEVGAP